MGLQKANGGIVIRDVEAEQAQAAAVSGECGLACQLLRLVILCAVCWERAERLAAAAPGVAVERAGLPAAPQLARQPESSDAVVPA